MKKITATLVMLILLMASITSVYAESTSDIKSIDTVISDIRAELGLKATDLISPEKVSNDLLEQLGDSVMEAMIGNHDLHEQMDLRMGGDGSATLTTMHIRMGYNYLYGSFNESNLGYGVTVNGNWNNRMGYTGWGMMNGSAFDGVMKSHNGPGYMMGNQYWKANVAQKITPSTAAIVNKTTTNAAVTQSWSSQAPCWNNGGSTPGSSYQAPINNTNTTNSGNWNNMRWNNNGMMN